MDIAELGFSVNAQAIDAATGKLNSLTAAAEKVSTAAKNIKVGAESGGLDKLEVGANKALEALRKMIAVTNEANQAFGKTKLQILEMKSAFAELSAIEQSAARVIMQVADAEKIVGNRIQDQLSATSKQIQVLESSNLLRSQGIITAKQLANVEATVTAEIMDNASAVKRSAAAYSELIAAQNSAAASAKRVANANAEAIASAAQSQHATNAQNDFNALLGVGGSDRAAQLQRMRADAVSAYTDIGQAAQLAANAQREFNASLGVDGTERASELDRMRASATAAFSELIKLDDALNDNSAAVARSQAGYRELVAAQEAEVAQLKRLANANAQATVAEARSQHATNAQRDFNSLLGVGGPNSSAQLAQMKRDAQAAFGAVETSGTSAMNKIAVSATKTTAEVGALRGAVESLGNVFKHAFGGLIAFAAVGAIAEFSKSLGEAQVKMQQILFTLSAVSGGMANAKQEFQFVTDISMKLGLNLEESAAGFSRLAASAYGAGLSTADLHKGFTGLSEAFTVLHAPADEVRRVLIQLDQGFSLGKIQMRDLRAISNSMPNVMELVKESFEGTGKSMSSMLAQGGIPAEEFFQRFTALLHDKYGPTAEEAAKGINSQLNNLHTTMMLLKTQSGFAEPFTEAISKLNKTLNDADVQASIKSIVKGMGESFKTVLEVVDVLIQHIGLLMDLLKALALALVLRGATAGLLAITGAAEGATGAIALLTGTATKGFTTMRGSFLLAGAAIAGWKGGEYLRDQFVIAREGGALLVYSIMQLWNIITNGGNAAWAAFKSSAFDAINAVAKRFADFAESFANASKFSVAGKSFSLLPPGSEGIIQKEIAGLRSFNNMAKEAQDQSTKAQKAYHDQSMKNADALDTMMDQSKHYTKAQDEANASVDAGSKGMKGFAESVSNANVPLTNYQKLLQSIAEKMQQQKLLNAELEASGGNVDKLTEGQKLLIKFNTELATTYKGTSAAMAEQARTQINGLIAQEKATQAVKDNYAALKKQAEALKAVNSVGSHAQAKADAIGGQAASLVPGSVAGKERGVSEAAGLKATLADQAKLLGNTKEAAAAYAAASTSVDQYAKALNDLAVAEKAASAVEQFDDSRSPYAQQERAIAAVQSHIGYLQKLQVANSKAFDPKILAGYQKALAGMKQQLQGIKLEDAANNVATGLKSLQSLAKEGSKDYEAMQVAIDAANLAAAIGAVLNQGMGDPYTAFARMAAMAVAVAALVGDIGTLGSMGFTDTAANRQASQGTGSVLGDATAKSESIAKATDITANATQKLVGINTGMLQALQSLQAGLGSAGGMLAGGAGAVDFSGVNLAVKSINEMGKLGGLSPLSGFGDFANIFGGSHKVTDQGVKILGGKISDLIDGTMLQAYEEVQSKSWAFGSTHTKEATGALSDGLGTQFALVIKSITDTVTEASKAIGLPLGEIQAKIAAFQVATTNISLKGLSAEDQQAALEAVFSKIFDDLTGAVVPFVGQFQKVGEGLGETLVRVATDVQVMQEAVKQLGITANTTDPEKFAQISVAFAELMGGVDNFITGMTSFVDKFAPDSHKFKVAQDAITSALGQVGLALPPTRDAMWELMQTLDASIPGDQKKIAALLQLTDTSDAYYTMLEDANNKLAASAQDLATKLYGTIGTTLDALTAKLDALKASTQSALGTALGSNSPLSAKDQLDLALKGLHSGLTTVDQVLSLGKKLYRGADYTKLYQQVMAGQGMGTGSAADVGAQVDQYNALYAQQQSMKAAQDAVSRFNDAKTLAGYVEQMSVNTGKSYSDVAGGLGFNLADLGKDLGVGSITGYLDSLKLNGLSQGESLANISAGTNEQVTLLKSIDQRLSAIESGTSATAANTGKAATQTAANGLKNVASTTRKVSA